ncbi:MAG: hypothetical protein REI95_02935, partial [Oxalicibacterium faecigallinarum]|nr:hypothetical protein [Oxalicibacterium faecigallinarum]
SALFKELGAPLNKHMWSWGSVRETDGAVFLRVWQDGTKKMIERGGRYYTWVTDVVDADQSLGANERRAHVEMIRGGRDSYMIMCQAVDDEAKVRDIAGFNEDELFLGGELWEFDGAIWLEHTGRVQVRDIRQK